ELEHARNYLAIQKIRYKNKFEYTLEAEKGTLECQTLKLVLQPLIENALYHGIQYIQHQGQIHIQVWQEEGLLMYRVQDNGVGMERNRCASLLEEDTIISSKGSGIGIRNVHRRIQLYYGIDYGLEIESEQDEGTTVLIKMPLTDQAY
ncbi:MAG: ATP-binding protein, partial [Niameybacter sp.]